MRVDTVAVLAFDRITPFHLAVPCAVFEDRSRHGLPKFNLRVCAIEPGKLRTDAGFAIETRHGLSALRKAGLVIVPSWRDVDERPPETLLRALQAAHARGACVVGLCLGAFVLAEAGLLDGRGTGSARRGPGCARLAAACGSPGFGASPIPGG